MATHRAPGWRTLVMAMSMGLCGVTGQVMAGAPAGDGAPACWSAPDDARLAVMGVTRQGALLLAGGAVARLAWLDTPEPWLPARKAALEQLLGGAGGPPSEIRARNGGAHDRWGGFGVVADVAVARGDAKEQCVNVQAWLLGQGLARLRPESANEPAPAGLQAWRKAEAAARAARLALWADPAYAPLPADLPQAILRREGRFVIVEGAVTSINERPGQTWLNFGSRWSEDMTVSAPARIWRMVKRSGLTVARLQGRVVRVRGIVESRGGPMIELASPAELEIAETGSRP